MARNDEKAPLKFTIVYAEYDNDDLGDDEDPTPEPDTGWYVDVEVGEGGPCYEIGPDATGPGHSTLDAAVVACEKWATDRGYRLHRPDMDALSVVERTAVLFVTATPNRRSTEACRWTREHPEMPRCGQCVGCVEATPSGSNESGG